jgi:methylmalonyl-CoA mutase N-terminal domain/subunit
VGASLKAVGAAAKEGTNLMPVLIRAVEAGTTLGEIVDALKKQFGEWREPPIYW